jgi:hypothetical protein
MEESKEIIQMIMRVLAFIIYAKVIYQHIRHGKQPSKIEMVIIIVGLCYG